MYFFGKINRDFALTAFLAGQRYTGGLPTFYGQFGGFLEISTTAKTAFYDQLNPKPQKTCIEKVCFKSVIEKSTIISIERFFYFFLIKSSTLIVEKSYDRFKALYWLFLLCFKNL